MTEKQLYLLREWFREEVEYLIKAHITKEEANPSYYDYSLPQDYYADKAFDAVVSEFFKEGY
jgi:hypothetical protein